MKSLRSLLVSTVVFALLSASALADPEIATIAVSEITPGMRGYGLTVFRGTEPERFDVEVIDVLHGFRPNQDLILVRTPHPLLERAHVVGGMSGSPIYLDGKLAGAYAYGWPYSTEAVAGVTPIANMLAELRRPSRPRVFPGSSPLPRPRQSASFFSNGELPGALTALRDMRPREQTTARSGFERVSTPVMLSGFDESIVRMLEDELSPFGLVPFQTGGGSATNDTTPARYVNGGGVGISLVTGDVRSTAVGTITHVARDGRLVGFGHPMLDQGELGLPASVARVLHILVSSQRSFKIAEGIGPTGTLTHDRQAAIVVDPNLRPATVPMRLRISGVPGIPKPEWNVELASHRAMTPVLAFAALGTALKSSVNDQTDIVYRIHSKVWIDGIPAPLEVTDFGIAGNGPGNAAALQSHRLFALLEVAYGNPFVESRVTRIETDIELGFGREALALVGASVTDAEVLPGERVPVTLTFRRFGEAPIRRTIEVDIPMSVAGQTITVEIKPGPAVPRETGRARDIGDLVRYVLDARATTELAVSIALPGRGLAFEGQIARDLPGSALDALATMNDPNASAPFAGRQDTFHPMGAVVLGTMSLELRVAPRSRIR